MAAFLHPEPILHRLQRIGAQLTGGRLVRMRIARLETFAPRPRTRRALGRFGQRDVGASAVWATAADSADRLADMEQDESMTRRALELLGSSNPEPYEAALAALREDTRECWEDQLESDPEEVEEGESTAIADAAGLRQFLEGDVIPWHAARRRELDLRPIIREQALGEALDPNRLKRLARYEVHLDRKLDWSWRPGVGSTTRSDRTAL